MELNLEEWPTGIKRCRMNRPACKQRDGYMVSANALLNYSYTSIPSNSPKTDATNGHVLLVPRK